MLYSSKLEDIKINNQITTLRSELSNNIKNIRHEHLLTKLEIYENISNKNYITVPYKFPQKTNIKQKSYDIHIWLKENCSGDCWLFEKLFIISFEENKLKKAYDKLVGECELNKSFNNVDDEDDVFEDDIEDRNYVYNLPYKFINYVYNLPYDFIIYFENEQDATLFKLSVE